MARPERIAFPTPTEPATLALKPQEIKNVLADGTLKESASRMAREVEMHEIGLLKEQLRKLTLENSNTEQASSLRHEWSKRIYGTITLYLLMVISILLFQGFGYRSFSLSSEVLVTLLATTTVNVIGLGYVVANYLFPNRHQKGKKEK